jgi:uncharacterized RDD family membrane protein YckC
MKITAYATGPGTHRASRTRGAPRTEPGLVTRFAAFAIDNFVMAVAIILANQTLSLTVDFFRLGTFALGARLLPVARAAVDLSVLIFYHPLSWTWFASSIGNGFFGLNVVRTSGKPMTLPVSFLRFAGYWLSALTFGFGFLWAVTDELRRALHDRLAGTRVVYHSTLVGDLSAEEASRR